MATTQRALRREDYRTFKYLAGFVREWTRQRRASETSIFTLALASRKTWRPARIGYAHDAKLEKVLVLAVYAKSDKSDLSSNERREIKRILDVLWKVESK